MTANLAREAREAAHYFTRKCDCPPASSCVCDWCQYGDLLTRLAAALDGAPEDRAAGGVKIARSKDWWLRMAEREGVSAVGAGASNIYDDAYGTFVNAMEGTRDRAKAIRAVVDYVLRVAALDGAPAAPDGLVPTEVEVSLAKSVVEFATASTEAEVALAKAIVRIAALPAPTPAPEPVKKCTDPGACAAFEACIGECEASPDVGLIAKKLADELRVSAPVAYEQIILAALKAAPIPVERYEHRKGGTYQVLGRGFIEADKTPAVVYRSEKDGTIWVRPEAEFFDGRFRALTAAELEEARATLESFRNQGEELILEKIALKARAETAEAAAGAMREALDWALAVIENLPSFRRERNCFVTLLESENEGFTAEWRKARKAALATIGAEVMSVVRAANDVLPELSTAIASIIVLLATAKQHGLEPDDKDAPSRELRKITAARDELRSALAALGGTHER